MSTSGWFQNSSDPSPHLYSYFLHIQRQWNARKDLKRISYMVWIFISQNSKVCEVQKAEVDKISEYPFVRKWLSGFRTSLGKWTLTRTQQNPQNPRKTSPWNLSGAKISENPLLNLNRNDSDQVKTNGHQLKIDKNQKK